MSLYDKYILLHRLPVVGQKIKFIKPVKFHWFNSLVEREKTLEPGKEYTVRHVELNSSSTYVWLEEFPDTDKHESGRGNMFFSMQSFQWEPPPLDPQSLIGYNILELDRLSIKGDLKVECKTFRITGEGLDFTPLYDKNGKIYDIQETEN